MSKTYILPAVFVAEPGIGMVARSPTGPPLRSFSSARAGPVSAISMQATSTNSRESDLFRIITRPPVVCRVVTFDWASFGRGRSDAQRRTTTVFGRESAVRERAYGRGARMAGVASGRRHDRRLRPRDPGDRRQGRPDVGGSRREDRGRASDEHDDRIEVVVIPEAADPGWVRRVRIGCGRQPR